MNRSLKKRIFALTAALIMLISGICGALAEGGAETGTTASENEPAESVQTGPSPEDTGAPAIITSAPAEGSGEDDTAAPETETSAPSGESEEGETDAQTPDDEDMRTAEVTPQESDGQPEQTDLPPEGDPSDEEGQTGDTGETGDAETELLPDDGSGEGDEEAQTHENEKCVVSIGTYDAPELNAGATVTIAIPVEVRLGADAAYSNMLPSGSVVAYSRDRAPGAYSKDITSFVDTVTVSVGGDAFTSGTGTKVIVGTIDDRSAKELGLTAKGGGVYADAAGNIFNAGDKYNTGFAVFDSLKVSKNIQDGFADIPVTISWSGVYGGGSVTVELTCSANGAASKTSTDTGTYTYHYTGTTQKSVSEAKLIVAGVSTAPELPKAGETFDLTLTLRNTSGKQAVQNITVTVDAEADAVLPVSGAFSKYITAIEAGKEYTAQFRVRSQGDIEDKPVKLYVTLEYEDENTEAHSASQSVVVNVEQPMRIKLDTPVLPSGGAVAGESYNVSMGVFNLGRTTLYNVTVQGVSDDPSVSTGASYYCGNMESGTGKTAEIRFIPANEGAATTQLLVTYENSVGEVFSTYETVSFYVSSYDDTDWYGDGFDLEPETTPEPQRGTEVWEVMAILPWWLYGIAGGAFMLIVVSIGVGARHRRIRAYENDEME